MTSSETEPANLPVCSAVPQLTAPPRAPILLIHPYKYVNT